jgi:hypothetical protein
MGHHEQMSVSAAATAAVKSLHAIADQQLGPHGTYGGGAGCGWPTLGTGGNGMVPRSETVWQPQS